MISGLWALFTAEQLNGKYREVFDKATMYGVYNGIEKDVYEDKLMNLFDVLMEAQHENKPVEKIIGTSIESFCKEYFKDEDTEKWSIKRLRALYRIMTCLVIFFGLDAILPLSDVADIFQIKSDIDPFIVFFIVGFILDSVLSLIMKPMIFKKKIKTSVDSVLTTFTWVTCLMGCIVFLDLKGFKVELPSFWLCLASGIYVFIYLIVRSAWRYKKFGRITKYDREEKQAKKEFNQEMSVKSGESISASGMANRFKRLNKRRIKKGLPEMTQREFADKVRKEEKWSKKADILVILAFAAFIIVPSAYEMITNSVIEGLILGTLLFVVEFGIYRLFAKANKSAEISRMKILDECEKEGITIVEYTKRFK